MKDKILVPLATIITFIIIFSIIIIMPSTRAYDGSIIQSLRYENSDLKIIFNSETKNNILEFDLKSHPSVNYIKPVGAGYQVVMWYDVNSLYSLENVLNNPEFIDLKTKEIVSREWQYVVWGLESYEIPKYLCENKLSLNNTLINECIQIGTEIKTRENWIPLNSRNIPIGKTRIGLLVEVKVGDYIDGIWNIGGQKINKHSSWTADLNSGLISYYDFEGGFGNIVIDRVTGKYNLSSNSSVWTTGKVGTYGMNLSRATSQFARTTSNVTELDGQNMTANCWVKLLSLDSSAGVNSAMKLGQNFNEGNAQTIEFGVSDNSVNRWSAFSPNNLASSTSNTGYLEEYAMLTLTYDSVSRNITVYTNTIFNASVGTNVVPSGEFWLAKSTQNQFAGGVYDECGLWNRTLTEAEIVQLYNGGSGITYIPPSSEEININLLSPLNETEFKTLSTNFSTNVSKTDGIEIQNVSLLIDGVINQTNSSGYSGFYNFTQVLSNGNYNWTIVSYGNDSMLYNASNGTLFFSVNVSDIEVILNEPENNTNKTYTELSSGFLFSGNVSYNTFDVLIENVSLEINYTNGTPYYTNTSFAGVQGTYNWLLYDSDFNNTNNSYNWIIYAYGDNGLRYDALNGTLFFNIIEVPIALPVQNCSYDNVSLGFYEGTLINSPISDCWTNMDYPPSEDNYFKISFWDTDSLQTINLSTLGNASVSSLNIEGKATSYFRIQITGTSTGFYQLPTSFGVVSGEQNKSIEITYWGCNSAGCTQGNSTFWIIISQDIIIESEGVSFITSIANKFNNILPDAEGLPLVFRIGILILFLLAINGTIWLGFSPYFQGTSLLFVSLIASILAIIYFTAIGYVPLGLVFLLALIILGVFYLKNR